MEIFQLQTQSWFLPRQLFLEDPTLSSREEPIYCHTLTGAMSKEHFHRIGLFNQNRNLDIYKWRYEHKGGILPISNIQILQTVRTEADVSILCEKLFFQVEDIFDRLTTGQQFYLFLTIMHTANELSSKLGWFRITTKMMGLNKVGECRMWVNQNHGSNEVQYPLANRDQQNWMIVTLFRVFTDQSLLFKMFIWSLQKQKSGLEAILKQLEQFVAKQEIEVSCSVNVANLIKASEEDGENRYSQLSARPSFYFKPSKDSTEVTLSQVEHSVMSGEQTIKSQISMTEQFCPTFSLKVPTNRKKKVKTNKEFSTNTAKPMFSHLQKASNNFLKIQEDESPSPIQSLGLHSRMQQSIVIDSGIHEPKRPSFNINQLQRLGRIGKFCESMTPQELIIQEFKDIYE